MLATSSSQEIWKYFMFAAIFYWDYSPLHQSSAELVLWGLLTQIFFADIGLYFFLTFHQLGVIWEEGVKGEVSVLFSFATRAFFREMVNSLNPLFPDFFVSFWSSFNPSKKVLWLDLRWFAGLECISNERIYQYHEYLAKITTFAPFIPPPHWFWKSVRYRPYFRVSQIVKF